LESSSSAPAADGQVAETVLVEVAQGDAVGAVALRLHRVGVRDPDGGGPGGEGVPAAVEVGPHVHVRVAEVLAEDVEVGGAVGVDLAGHQPVGGEVVVVPAERLGLRVPARPGEGAFEQHDTAGLAGAGGREVLVPVSVEVARHDVLAEPVALALVLGGNGRVDDGARAEALGAAPDDGEPAPVLDVADALVGGGDDQVRVSVAVEIGAGGGHPEGVVRLRGAGDGGLALVDGLHARPRAARRAVDDVDPVVGLVPAAEQDEVAVAVAVEVVGQLGRCRHRRLGDHEGAGDRRREHGRDGEGARGTQRDSIE
jgi:hypothetical protein